MKELTAILETLANHFSQFEKQNTNISNGSVGWHCEHSLRVIIGVLETLAKANPEEYKWAFNWKRSLILFKGKIPRGKAKSPKHVLPVGEISDEKLLKLLAESKRLISHFDEMPPNVFFKHPFFGLLNKKATARFLYIHTKHHSDIINDILC